MTSQSCDDRNTDNDCEQNGHESRDEAASLPGQNRTDFSHNAVITIAIRLRYDYNPTTIRLRRIARACFHSTRAKNEHVNFSSQSYRIRIEVESQE